MVNRKKSPVVDKERKTGNKISKEDGDEHLANVKRSRKDSDNQKQRGPEAPNQDPDEPKPGPSGTNKGIASAAKGDNGTVATSEKPKENPPNPIPVVSHQIATRSVTGRLSKRLRSYSPPKSPPPTKKQAKDAAKAGTSNAAANSGTPETKTRKQWEQWSIQDKDLFFEALNEHGKDFEAIQQSISQKLKKRDPTCGVRTKDHIRHFYYRTWHKITKCIDSEGVDDCNKQALELYGLINYGELRKRIGSKLDEKMGQKLNDLVHKGVTVVKVKQKNHRIKTPTCRALKKIHHIEEHKEEERAKMPDRITIEMFPRSNTAWAEVQTLAQNPRVRVTLRLSKRISSLIEFLNKKWMPDRVRLKEQLKESEISTKEIKVSIQKDAKLSPIMVKHNPAIPKLELSFNNYMQTMKVQQQSTASPPQKRVQKSIFSNLEDLQIQQPSAATASTSTRSTSTGAPADGVQDNQVSSTDEISASTDTFCQVLMATSSEKHKDDKADVLDSPVKPERLETFSGQFMDESAIPFSDMLPDNKKLLPNDERDTMPACKAHSGESAADLVKPKEPSQAEVEANDKQTRLQNGLVLADCGTMTVAEVYMMLGCPKQLSLEYEWVEKKTSEDIWELNKKLTNMLRRLVHLATTEFIDFKKVKPLSKSPAKCSCGAGNTGTPPNSKLGNGRSPRVNSPATSRVKLTAKSPSTPSNSRRNLRPGTPSRDYNGGPLVAPGTPTSSKHRPQNMSPEVRTLDEPTVLTTQTLGGQDHVFKMPTAMPPRAQPIRPVPIAPAGSIPENSQLLQQLSMVQNSELFGPKRTGQRRLNRRRPPIMVQRTLLPKARTPARQIMTLAMVPGLSMPGQTASFQPVSMSSLAISGKPCPTQTTTVCAPMGANAIPVTQDFGVPRGMTTVTGKVTKMSVASINKSTTARRIIPIPVTTDTENSSVFIEAPELGCPTKNILKEAAMEAKIGMQNSPIHDCARKGTDALHTPPHGQADMASQPVDEPIQTPAFSQSFTLTGADPILSASASSELPTSRRILPPNMSTLLDISVPSVPDMSESTDKLIDLELMNSNSSFGGLVGDKDASLSSLLNTTEDPGALSPTKGFKGITALGPDEQWLGQGDISMSCFLQDTPVKKPPTDQPSTSTTIPSSIRLVRQPNSAQPFILGESSRDSLILGNVETTFEVMMNENSMDYMSKFADLAAHINSSYQDNPSLRKTAELLGEKAS